MNHLSGRGCGRRGRGRGGQCGPHEVARDAHGVAARRREHELHLDRVAVDVGPLEGPRVDEQAPLPQIGRDCDGVGRACREEDLGQLRRAGLGQRAVKLEEARRLAEPVDLALAQRRCRLADVVEGGGGFLFLAITRLCAKSTGESSRGRVDGVKRREI